MSAGAPSPGAAAGSSATGGAALTGMADQPVGTTNATRSAGPPNPARTAGAAGTTITAISARTTLPLHSSPTTPTRATGGSVAAHATGTAGATVASRPRQQATATTGATAAARATDLSSRTCTARAAVPTVPTGIGRRGGLTADAAVATVATGRAGAAIATTAATPPVSEAVSSDPAIAADVADPAIAAVAAIAADTQEWVAQGPTTEPTVATAGTHTAAAAVAALTAQDDEGAAGGATSPAVAAGLSDADPGRTRVSVAALRISVGMGHRNPVGTIGSAGSVGSRRINPVGARNAGTARAPVTAATEQSGVAAGSSVGTGTPGATVPTMTAEPAGVAAVAPRGPGIRAVVIAEAARAEQQPAVLAIGMRCGAIGPITDQSARGGERGRQGHGLNGVWFDGGLRRVWREYSHSECLTERAAAGSGSRRRGQRRSQGGQPHVNHVHVASERAG